MHAKNLIDAFNRFSDRAFDAMMITIVCLTFLPGIVYVRLRHGGGQKARDHMMMIGSISVVAWMIVFGAWSTYG